jgi:hypothetical protein
MFTYPNTSYIRSCFVQERYHMSPFGDCALETGVKGIAGEEGENVGKAGKPRVRTIVVDHRLESGDTANGFSGTSSGNGQS